MIQYCKTKQLPKEKEQDKQFVINMELKLKGNTVYLI